MTQITQIQLDLMDQVDALQVEVRALQKREGEMKILVKMLCDASNRPRGPMSLTLHELARDEMKKIFGYDVFDSRG